MGKVYEAIDGRLREFILAQPVFFVGTAPSGADGHVNVSPKGVSGSFAVIDELTVAYLDYGGSGIETVAHLRDNGRIVLMFCAFAGPPKIVRLHGRGAPVFLDDPRFAELAAHFPGVPFVGARAIVVASVTRISDSCGFAVPLMRYDADREVLAESHARKGPERLAQDRATKNAVSIDGLPGLDSAAAEAGLPPGELRHRPPSGATTQPSVSQTQCGSSPRSGMT
jgi:hypothetical protein